MTVPRHVYEKIKKISEVSHSFESKNFRAARDNEVAQMLGMTKNAYAELKREIFAGQVSLDEQDEAKMESTYNEMNEQYMPSYQYERIHICQEIYRLLALLSEREQQILNLYYKYEYYLKEIAHELGISESRVSQIHKNLLKKLKKEFERLSLPIF
jgi:RNA polymerase sigma factor for flagellar operon FliA